MEYAELPLYYFVLHQVTNADTVNAMGYGQFSAIEEFRPSLPLHLSLTA